MFVECVPAGGVCLQAGRARTAAHSTARSTRSTTTTTATKQAHRRSASCSGVPNSILGMRLPSAYDSDRRLTRSMCSAPTFFVWLCLFVVFRRGEEGRVCVMMLMRERRETLSSQPLS